MTTPVGRLVVVHSKGKEARKLEGLAEFRVSVGVEDRILRGFYVSRAVRYVTITNIYSTHPVFRVFGNLYLKRFTIKVRNASQECESGTRSRISPRQRAAARLRQS